MNVLVVAAHCDDEILGCGGTMARYIESDHKVDVFILCPQRGERASLAAQIMGATVWFSDLIDQKFDTYPLLEITQRIEKIVDITKPEIIFTHWIGDLNLDHEITARATLTACRPLPKSTIREIYGFEIPSSTEWGTDTFYPAHFISLGHDHRQKKFDSLRCYADEIKPKPHARSMTAIEANGLKRGASIGEEYAEAFHPYRTIRRI